MQSPLSHDNVQRYLAKPLFTLKPPNCTRATTTHQVTPANLPVATSLARTETPAFVLKSDLAICQQVEWLKNDEPLRVDIPHKYEVVGNGTQLRVRNIGYADTGAYMCQATSVGGMARDISSLVVQENPAPSECLRLIDSFL